jgi:hypothetical protein
MAVSQVGEISLGLASSPSEIRVLTLLSPAGAEVALPRFTVTACKDAGEFDDSFGKGDFDIAVFDASLGAGWPTDAVMALCSRPGRRFPLLLLFDQINDLVVVESQVTSRDVWCTLKQALATGELAMLIAGLAALGRVQARLPSRN